MAGETSVLVADAQRLLADALTVALSAAPGVVALPLCPASTEEAVDAAARLQPDVAILDYWMVGRLDGPSATRAILEASPATAVLLLSWVHGPQQIDAAIAAGAAGFLPKSIGLGVLEEAIVRAANGERPVFATQLEQLSAAIRHRAEDKARAWEALMSLTSREVEVVQALATGRSAAEVAALLHVSAGTVRNHVQSVLRKTGARSQREVVQLARSVGLVGGPRHVAPPGGARVAPSSSGDGVGTGWPARTTVVVVDEQLLFAESVGRALAHYHDLEVVGVVAGSGHDAVLAAIDRRPDLVLYDYWMPGTAGPAATRYLATWAPGTALVLSSWLHGPTEVARTEAAGAMGLLPKSVNIDQLHETLRAAHRGEALPHVHRSSLRPVPGPVASPPTEGRRWEQLGSLSPRELEVLRLLARGRSVKETARELNIALGTARNHVTSILKKTGTTSAIDAVGMAHDEGLIREVGRPGPG